MIASLRQRRSGGNGLWVQYRPMFCRPDGGRGPLIFNHGAGHCGEGRWVDSVLNSDVSCVYY